ncbi:MAG: MFS transporter [Gammaproteobacteria bacterium]
MNGRSDGILTPESANYAGRRELWAWAFFDFANSGYTTVVQTTIFSTYFVGVVASGPGFQTGLGTLLWSVSIGLANFIVMVCAPIIGAVTDYRAHKKRFLFISSLACVVSTALLATVGPGDTVWGMMLVIVSAIMFAVGENLIAAFLPEIVPKENMGRMSGYGWSLGYFGGLLTLSGCLAYIFLAESQGLDNQHYVPVTMLITAAIFAVTAAPTFIWLKERALPSQPVAGMAIVFASFTRLRRTFERALHFRDLFRFLVTLAVYQSGVSTVVVLAAVYAQEVMGFEAKELILLIMVVNVTAAVGAFFCGHLQDRIGSVKALAVTLFVWIIAIGAGLIASEAKDMWIVGNLIGLAMGGSQSVGRALVGQFTPDGRSGEFLGLWGLVNRLSAITGPMSYGIVNYLSRGDHRLSLLSTLAFFIVGLVLLRGVDEQRGKAAAVADV